jgi:hypothetical protein
MKTDIKAIGREVVGWIHVAQDRGQRQVTRAVTVRSFTAMQENLEYQRGRVESV